MKKLFLNPFIFLLLFMQSQSRAEEKHENGEKPDISGIMMHHILDSHDWHLTDIPGKWLGREEKLPIALHLPWFFYNKTEKKFEFFRNTHALVERGKYVVMHEHVYAAGESKKMEAGSQKMEDNEHSTNSEHAEVSYNPDVKIIDLSLTKTSFQMMLVMFFLLYLFISVAKRYKQNPVSSPKGIQSVLEPIIVFVRDDIAKPNIGPKYEKLLPLLLCFFFFIWISNLLGLVPVNMNIMGNISVTAALAIVTFTITQFRGSKDYWAHIFWFPGVNIGVKFLMMIVEIVGLFTKPFALTVRLFANIAAGHFMILGLVGLIFIIKYAAIPLTFIFVLFISTLELLVGIVQAYVFTLLSSIFIGSAMVSHHAHEEGH